MKPVARRLGKFVAGNGSRGGWIPLALALAFVVMGCTDSTGARALAPNADRDRFETGFGISYLPPQGDDWLEQRDDVQVRYLKKTSAAMASFYTGAIAGPMRAPLPDDAALLAFVKARKEDLGTEGRFTHPDSAIVIDPQAPNCVNYRMSMRDTDAKNQGAHDYLIILSVGRYCLHPQDRSIGVDIFYSIRHAPTFDPAAFVAEGESFLDGLEFSAPTGGQGKQAGSNNE